MFWRKKRLALTVTFTAEELLALSTALMRDAIGTLFEPPTPAKQRERRVLTSVCEKLRRAARPDDA